MSKLIDNLKQAERARRALSDGAAEPEAATALRKVITRGPPPRLTATPDAQATAESQRLAAERLAAEESAAGLAAQQAQDEADALARVRERLSLEQKAPARSREGADTQAGMLNAARVAAASARKPAAMAPLNRVAAGVLVVVVAAGGYWIARQSPQSADTSLQAAASVTLRMDREWNGLGASAVPPQRGYAALTGTASGVQYAA